MTAPLPEWVADAVSTLPALCTPDEVGAIFRCSRRTVSRMVEDGRLRGFRTGGGNAPLVVTRASVASLLAALGAAS